jgi:hypothetical protein
MPAFDGVSLLSTTHYNSISGAFIMHVFVPMGTDMVLSATFDAMLFSELISNDFMLWQTGNLFMVDAEGTFIANFRPSLVTERQNFVEQAKVDSHPHVVGAGVFYQTMITTNEGSGTYFYEGRELLCIYKNVSSSKVGWHIAVAAPLNESPISNVQNGLLLSALVFIIVGIILSAFMSALAVRPFNKIKEQAAQINKEKERAKLLINAAPYACIYGTEIMRFLK